MEVLPLRRRRSSTLGCCCADVLAGGDQEAGGAAGRVADLVGGLRARSSSTISWMMCRGVRNWPLTARRVAILRQHVLVEVAVGVAVGHRDVVEHVDHLATAAPGSGW